MPTKERNFRLGPLLSSKLRVLSDVEKTRMKRTFLALSVLAAASLAHAQSAPAPVTPAAAARFLQQASWGPTPASIAEVQSLGMAGWIDAQIALDSTQWSPIPDPSVDAKGNTSLAPAQNAFFVNAINGRDQLRQRMAFAVGQIWVVSGVKLQAQAMVPYIRLMQTDAFTTFDKLMYDVTLSPAMGHYLDMVNNNKATPGHAPDENYAREILQLFTIGLVQLDPWGRPLLDANKNTIPNYDQNTIEAFARAFTGWTYAPLPGAHSRFPNPANWDAPMVAFEANHDMTAKTLLNGQVIPMGQTAEMDLKDALNNIFTHQNVAPFISRQLIQRFVSSDPSPDYVKRIADVFTATHGDLGAVIKAILLDPEARAGDDGSENQSTKLREPLLWTITLLRELGATVTSPNALTGYASVLGQTIYYPPTVFNYFLPGYDINISATQTYNAPEFQLLGEATAESAAGIAYNLAFGKPAGVSVDYFNYVAPLGTKPTNDEISQMIDSLNRALLGGRMTQAMHDAILAACEKATSSKAMVETAVYLIASSWDFQVQQ